MEREEREKEEEKKGWTMRELLAKSGEVLDNPLLVEIIEAAPSPNAADKHVVETLGWPCELGKRVRHAARIRKLFPGEWEKVKKSSVRPAEGMFSFVPGHSVGKSAAPVVQASEDIRMEAWTNNSPIAPFLLKDFRAQNASGIFTSFDGDGAGFLHRIKKSVLADLWQKNEADRLFAYLSHLNAHDFRLCLPMPGGTPNTDWTLSIIRGENHSGECFDDGADRRLFSHYALRSVTPFNIWGGSVLELDDKSTAPSLPRLVKILLIEDNTENGLAGFDRIAVRLYCDLAPTAKGIVGAVNFRRSYGYPTYAWNTSFRAEFVLSANYVITENDKIRLMENGAQLHAGGSSISVACNIIRGRGRDFPGGFPAEAKKEAEEAFEKKYELFSRGLSGWAKTMYLAGIYGDISLTKIAGRSFLENPPRRLIELFV